MSAIEKTAYTELARIQQGLKVPKNRKVSYGNTKFNYRSAEDILEGVKPILEMCTLTVSDEMVLVGDRIYTMATATLTYMGQSVSACGYAREPEEKNGMDSCQLSGSVSSYARKYALGGLFCIDDSKDSDSMAEESNRLESLPATGEQMAKIRGLIETKTMELEAYATIKKIAEKNFEGKSSAQMDTWIKGLVALEDKPVNEPATNEQITILTGLMNTKQISATGLASLNVMKADNFTKTSSKAMDKYITDLSSKPNMPPGQAVHIEEPDEDLNKIPF